MHRAPRSGGGPPLSDLAHVEAWIFDLDNTLYPAGCNLFSQVDRRIGEFISRYLGIAVGEARRLQKRFFREHGTTLRGLMTVYGIAPEGFLDFVHDIDLSLVPPSDALAGSLARLPGRKFIFTNASKGHAARVVERLGVAEHFEGVFDIAAADYLPKPDPRPYRRLVEHFGIEPEASVMVEDIARNLAPAAALGMTTVWVPGRDEWSLAGADSAHVHYVAEDLPGWLGRFGAPPSG